MLIPYTAPRATFQKELEIKKSIFLATLIPVKNEEEAQEAIAKMKKEKRDATHNCSAYRIGTERIYEKSSDDGEPQGTAGHPMLHVLQMNELTNTLAIVTRWFGGIKLGAGGLTRAYTQSLADAVKGSGVPVIEVHISNVHAREAVRHHSFLSPVARGIIVGLGPLGYGLGIAALASLAG